MLYMKITSICSEKFTKYRLTLYEQKMEFPMTRLPVNEATTSSIQFCDVTSV